MTNLTITALREKIYQVFDFVVKTGKPQFVERGGHMIKISLDKKKDKLLNLKPHQSIVGNPDDLVDTKVGEWHEGTKL